MSSEKQMRRNVVEILRKAGLDARPVENPCDPGFPDVEYIGGLLELKEVERWPSKASTPLRVEHYTQEQRIWHDRRARKGGRIHVLLQVGSEFLLFRGRIAAEVLGNVPQAELRSAASASFPVLASLREGLRSALEAP